MTPRLVNFCEFYSTFDRSNIESLHTLYTEDVLFKDPVHEVRGIDAMRDYLSGLCTELLQCNFFFQQHIEGSDQVFLRWTMHYAHPKISGGKTLTLEGATELRFEGNLVSYHCDYYDMGAMLYERLPVIGAVIRWLRKRLA